MLTLQDAFPCKVCGKLPILQGGTHSHCGRLVCPDYKSEKIQHGNLDVKTKGIPMGFTKWCYIFWTKEQMENKGIPTIVKEWNSIHG